MAKAIHMMIRVRNEHRSVAFYEQAFGFKPVHRLDFDAFTLVYLRGSETDFEIELTINKNQKDPYDLGNGYGHFAVCVDDLEATHRQFTDLGMNPRKLVDFKNNGTPVARFFFVTDPDGYEIEVLERGGHYQ